MLCAVKLEEFFGLHCAVGTIRRGLPVLMSAGYHLDVSGVGWEEQRIGCCSDAVLQV